MNKCLKNTQKRSVSEIFGETRDGRIFLLGGRGIAGKNQHVHLLLSFSFKTQALSILSSGGQLYVWCWKQGHFIFVPEHASLLQTKILWHVLGVWWSIFLQCSCALKYKQKYNFFSFVLLNPALLTTFCCHILSVLGGAWVLPSERKNQSQNVRFCARRMQNVRQKFAPTPGLLLTILFVFFLSKSWIFWWENNNSSIACFADSFPGKSRTVWHSLVSRTDGHVLKHLLLKHKFIKQMEVSLALKQPFANLPFSSKMLLYLVVIFGLQCGITQSL